MELIYFYLGTFAILTIAFLVKYCYFRKSYKLLNGNVRIIIIIGSGGHTSEILRLTQNLDSHYQPRLYVMADSDITSESKIHAIHDSCFCDYSIVKIPRSRQVGQSYVTAIVTTLNSVINCIKPVFHFKPDLVLCNGPGTCVPVCISTFFLSKIFLWKTRIVFVESICRVQSLSLSGKILRYFADSVIVQWPELQDKYPFSIYLGRLF